MSWNEANCFLLARNNYCVWREPCSLKLRYLDFLFSRFYFCRNSFWFYVGNSRLYWDFQKLFRVFVWVVVVKLLPWFVWEFIRFNSIHYLIGWCLKKKTFMKCLLESKKGFKESPTNHQFLIVSLSRLYVSTKPLPVLTWKRIDWSSKRSGGRFGQVRCSLSLIALKRSWTRIESSLWALDKLLNVILLRNCSKTQRLNSTNWLILSLRIRFRYSYSIKHCWYSFQIFISNTFLKRKYSCLHGPLLYERFSRLIFVLEKSVSNLKNWNLLVVSLSGLGMVMKCYLFTFSKVCSFDFVSLFGKAALP